MPEPARKPRVLVVEDDDAIRIGLRSTLQGQNYDVRAESTGVGITAAAEEFRPDLAILDVRLGSGPDGYQVAQTLRKTSDLPIIFLTAADDLESRLAGFEAGGDDYLIKPFSMPELLARANALLRRSGRLEAGVWQLDDLVVDEEARVVTRGGKPVPLTQIEFQVLCQLMRHPGKVLSKVRLMSAVWGFEFYDPNLVEKHVGSLRRKLEELGPRLVHTVRGSGYVLKGP